jgi:hypothetical protein
MGLADAPSLSILARHRAGVVACLLLALLASVWSVQRVSLSPPGLSPRVESRAAASVGVLIDTPTSPLADLRRDTGSLPVLTERAVLLGTVMAGAPVRAAIAHRAGVPVESLRIGAPLMPDHAQPEVEVGVPVETIRGGRDQQRREERRRRAPADPGTRLSDRHTLTIRADTTVPLLHIHSTAPTAAVAERLADAAVWESQAYLAQLARAHDVPGGVPLRLVALGAATSTELDDGARWLTALLAFLVTLAVACLTLVFVLRVRAGWQVAAAAEATLPAPR